MDDLVKQFLKTTLDTAQKNKWTPGGFANNATQGVGDLVGGVVALPGAVWHGVTHPEDAGPMTTQFVKGVAGSLNNTVGQPVNPNTGQLQMPSLSKAEQYAYEKPIDVATNVAVGAGTVAKLAKGAGMVGKAGEAGKIAEAGKVASKAPAGWSSEGMKVGGLPPIGGSFPGMNLVPKSAEEVAAGKPAAIPQNVVDTFNKQFDLPTKIGWRLNKDRVANTVLSDNVGNSFDSMQKAANAVTGSTGEIPKLIYRALEENQKPVDLGDTITKGFERIKSVPELKDSPGKLEGFQNIMKSLFSDPDVPGEATLINQPLKAWDAMQELERRGHAYLSKSTYLTNNPYYEDLGHAFINTAQDVKDVLHGQLKDVDLTKYETPDMRARLGDVSSKLLERYDATPKTVADLRAFQKPYVDLSTMIKHTKASDSSIWSKAAKTISAGLAGGGGAAAGSAGGPVGMGAGALLGSSFLGPAIEPIISAAVQKFGPDIAMNTAKAFGKISQNGLPAIALPKVAAGLPALSETALNVPTPGEQISQIDPSKQGAQRYSLPEQGQSAAMTTQDYTTQQNSLTQQIAQAKSTGNSVQQSQLEGQLAQLNNSWTNQKPIRDAGVATNNVVGLGNAAHTLIQNADISVLNLNGSFDKLLNSTDPKNQKLGRALQSIQNTTGIDLSSAKTKDALIAGLDQAVAVAQNQYNAQLQQFSGGKSVAPPARALPSASSQGLPAIGQPVHYNFDFGASGEGLPANP